MLYHGLTGRCQRERTGCERALGIVASVPDTPRARQLASELTRLHKQLIRPALDVDAKDSEQAVEAPPPRIPLHACQPCEITQPDAARAQRAQQQEHGDGLAGAQEQIRVHPVVFIVAYGTGDQASLQPA